MLQSRFFKVAILASSRFLRGLANVIILMFLARMLSKHDYGTYQQTIFVYMFVMPLLTLGLPNALYFFLPEGQSRSRTILMENLVPLWLIGIAIGLFFVLGGNHLVAWRFNNPDLVQTLWILAPLPLLMLPVWSVPPCLMAQDKPKQVAIFNVVSRLAKLVIVLGVTLIWRTPVAAIIATVIASAAILTMALKVMLDSCQAGPILPTRTGMWLQMKYAIPLGFASIFGMISRSLDKAIVSSMALPEQFAVYVNGAMEIPLVSILTASVTAVLIPDFVKMYQASEFVQIRQLWHRAMVKCLRIYLPVMCFALVMAPEIMRVIFSAKYAESAYPFRVYALILPVRSTTFGAILMAINRTRMVMIGAILNLIANLAFSILFVHLIGPVGAAWATMISIVGLGFFYSVFIGKYLDFGGKSILPWKSIFQLIVAVIPVTAIIFIVNNLLPSNDILRLTIISVIFFAVLSFFYDRMNIMKYSEVLDFVKKKLAKNR
jgi:O-antigen/teichoic acid export membrane protein